jgi:nitrogen fixation protein FixH
VSTPVKSVTGRQVFAVMVAFFGVIIAVNTTLAVLAVKSWSGLVVENGYVASQAFNAELAEARREDGLGWRESFGYAGGKLTLILSDAQSRPIGNAKVAVALQRPSTDRQDRNVVLSETEPGKYELALALPSGLWDAEATVHTSNGASLRRLYRLPIAGDIAK